MRHLKTCFGHALHSQNSQDPEDPYIQVYNLVYDRTGEMIITGDDTGLIKVWSASTGLLITSLKGHTLAINAMEMNHSNEYLASCSGDGFVLVWDVRTGRPLTALKEDNDDPILILLFYREVEEFLVAASEKGNLYVYPLRDIIKCQGGRLGTQYNRHLGNGGVTHSCTIRKMCVKPARQTRVEQPNGILSIDMHPEGYLAAGTERGDIIVFDKGEVSMVWKEHNDNCHMLKWAKRGGRLLTASFDGTAKVWLLNSQRSTVTMHYKEATPGTRLTGELKCWSMAWSEQGRYAIASFCRKLRRRGDQEKNFPQIQVYDCFQDELVTIIDASRIGDILKMESPFLLLDAHPSQETVLLSADNEGLIVVWDILSSEILRVFYERGFHMRLPNLEMQILEGGWSPDGLSFAVSTAFGSFSVYGYGMREFYTQTPVEQFYTSDSSHAMVEDQVGFRVMALDHDQEFHLLDRGTICNFYRLPYMYPLAQLARPVTAQQHWSTSLLAEIENHRSDLLFFNNYRELEEVQQDIYSRQQSHIEVMRDHRLLQYQFTFHPIRIEQTCEEFHHEPPEPRKPQSLKVRDGEQEFEIYEPSSQRLKRQRVIDDDNEVQEFYARGSPEDAKVQTRASMKHKDKTVAAASRRLRQTESSVESTPPERSSYPRTRQRAMASQGPSQEQRLTRITQLRQQQVEEQPRNPRRVTSDVCKRCKTAIQGEFGACQICKTKYHEHCAGARLVHEDSHQKCFNCLAKQHPRKPLSRLSLAHRFLQTNQLMQIGDQMMFFTQGYEQFLQRNLYQLDMTRLAGGPVFPSDELTNPAQVAQLPCTVQAIEYEAPTSVAKKADQLRLSIQMLLTLQMEHGTFQCYYYPQVASFLVPLSQYQASLKLRLHANQMLSFEGDAQYLFMGIEPNDPHLQGNYWQTLKCRGMQDEVYALRQQPANFCKFNVWDVKAVGGRATDFEGLDAYLPASYCQQIHRLLMTKLHRNVHYREYFAEPVDTEQYTDYFDYVLVGSDVGTIADRLTHNYYRSKAHILHDIQMIQVNAYRFNAAGSMVCDLATSLVEALIAAIDCDPSSESEAKMQLRPRRQRPQQMDEEEPAYEIQTRGRLKRQQ